jgi:hypothetical protein
MKHKIRTHVNSVCIHTTTTFATVDLFYFIKCEDLHEQTFIEKAFGWLRFRLHMTSHYYI